MSKGGEGSREPEGSEVSRFRSRNREHAGRIISCGIAAVDHGNVGKSPSRVLFGPEAVFTAMNWVAFAVIDDDFSMPRISID